MPLLKIESASIQNIETAILYWIELLAEEKYSEAYELTLHDPYYQWSPADIESVINGYGLPHNPTEDKCKVTPPANATNEHNLNPYKEISFFNDSETFQRRLPDMQAIGSVLFDLPINGEWSDLSAGFTIFKEDDFFMLELNEIHVL